MNDMNVKQHEGMKTTMNKTVSAKVKTRRLVRVAENGREIKKKTEKR